MGHKKKKKFAKSRESDVLDAGSEKRNVQASQAADSSININLNVNVSRNIRQQPFDENIEDTGEQQEDTEESVYRSVIRKCTPKLVEDLEPDYLLDWFAQAGFLTSVKVRDIRELNTTTEKTHKILELVSSKADRGYKELKDALIKTRQHNLVEYLEDTEKEVELEKEAKRKDLGPLTADRPTDAGEKPVDKAHKTVVQEESVKTYAEILNQSRPVEENITCNIVNYISVQDKATTDSKTDDKKYSEIKKFLDSVSNFKGDFILLIDRYENLYNIEALALVPWIAVLDFDPKSRQSGVLTRVENSLKNHRSLHILSVQNKSSITEQSTNWIFMSGCHDRPDTITSVEYKKWRKEVRPHLENHLKILKEFSEVYTHFTLLIVWPNVTEKAKHVKFVVEELEECLSPTVVLVYESLEQVNEKDPDLVAIERDDDIHKIHITLQDMCTFLSSRFIKKPNSFSADFQLPDAVDSVLGITEDKAQWLSEELEVIYFKNNTGISYEQKELQEEEDMFFKGGTLNWAWWYQVGPGHLDVERDQLNDIVEYLQKKYINAWKSGIVTLYHAPGSGGTTLAQRVLWTLRKEVPCAQLKRGSSSVFDLAERIRFLCDKTSKPVFILIDGEDEQRVESVRRSVREHCVIIFYVKRYPYKMDRNRSKIHEGKIWLNRGVSKTEATVLGLKYSKQCKSVQKTVAISNLVRDVEDGILHSIFDFGLTVHSYEYIGIESYVQGYLRLNERKKATLEPWQQAVGYLALVYYYGQTSLPCFFISCILNEEQKMTHVEDLPKEMSEFIVREINDDKKNVVRISHYLIAKEILDQILTKGKTIKKQPSPFICQEAKQSLWKFAVQFVKTTGEINRGSLSNMLCRTMTRTFISRDNKIVGESETQANRSKRSKLSQVLEDVCSSPPYTERFKILQQLNDSFPSQPQFRAHLGRLYTICRPEEEEKAEKNFKEALEMCQKDVAGLEVEDIPYAKRQDLRNIYHMYGNMFVLRIAKYTGRFLGDIPVKSTDKSIFQTTALNLLESVKSACDLFFRCRYITPAGCEESFGYIGEIQVRLMLCDFVNSKCEEGNLQKYIEKNDNEITEFIEECYTVLDELFIECFSAIEPEKMDNNVMNCTEWYAALFKTTPTHGISRLRPKDDVYSRRMNIAKMKMKYSTKKSFGVLECINNESDICYIVRGYERNFEDYEGSDEQRLKSKRAIDIDYREWLYAIRHHLFPKEYEIDVVLQHVQAWYDLLHSPYSRFYLFVLKSLLGIGVTKGSGNSRLLLEAQELKEVVLKYSKYMAKPRYPREWLGPATSTIRRLAQGKRFFGQVEGRDADRAIDSDINNLDIRTGTICPPNDKPASGIIYLDQGQDYNVTVQVFFVPARCEMKGTSYQGTRVEFKIGFSMSHGYEAFGVKQLGHVLCKKCNLQNEKRSCDTAISCSSCGAEIKVK